MSNPKYFLKRRNYILDLRITLIFALAGLLIFFTSPSYALGWNDDEWIQSGCPKSASGKWANDNPETTDLRFLSINNSEVTYISKNDEAQKFGIDKSSFSSNYQYVKIKPADSKKETILKIRPHLVHMNLQKETKNTHCLIKVFTYKNERHAKTDRYSGWNIFRLIKQ